MQTHTAKTAPNATRAADQARAAAEAKVKAAEAKKPAKAKAEPKVDPMLTKKVTIATEGKKNPKKEGSKSHARFALYKDGMTVQAYLEASVAAGQDRKAARADLKWDTDHGFVTIA